MNAINRGEAQLYPILTVKVKFNTITVFRQGFVKVVKNKAYFKRYQVKFRRRRGETPNTTHTMFSSSSCGGDF